MVLTYGSLCSEESFPWQLKLLNSKKHGDCTLYILFYLYGYVTILCYQSASLYKNPLPPFLYNKTEFYKNFPYNFLDWKSFLFMCYGHQKPTQYFDKTNPVICVHHWSESLVFAAQLQYLAHLVHVTLVPCLYILAFIHPYLLLIKIYCSYYLTFLMILR